MTRLLISASFLCALALTGPSFAGETPAPADAKVSFANLKDGDEVTSPVTVQFAITGMEIAPAGTDKPNTGHHHVLLDRVPFGEGPDGAEEANANIPADDNNIHFGKGQTEAKLELTPGKHTLQLVFGDKDHIPHNPVIKSEVITITVK
jgi:Domain of unknown function (DUF4399)